MIEIKLIGTSVKRPWIARLTGLESKDGKTRFARDFSAATVTKVFSAENRYFGSIHSDGIFEVCEAINRYYITVFGSEKVVILYGRDIFPDDWGDYMREHNCSYEELWAQAWGALSDTYDRMRGMKKPLVLTNAAQASLGNLDDM